MRLDFNVLWVEDNQNNVKSQATRINFLLKKEGFRLQTLFAATLDEAMGYLSDDIHGDHIDLILMDYDLGAGGKGDDGLVAVRNKFQYKDIIFYSSQAAELMDKVAAKRVEGVYCSTRDDLPDTVDGVFEALVKKVLDIDHSRGIVMGATSDVDHLVNECLQAIFDISDEKQRATTLDKLASHVKEKEKRFTKDLVTISNIKHVSELADMTHFYTSADRLRLLMTALKSIGRDDGNIRTVQDYNDTVPARNTLAHVRVETKGFSRKLFDKKDKELTSEIMKDLRLKLLGHQEFFEKLSADLKSALMQ